MQQYLAHIELVISTLSLSILCNQLNAMLHHAIAESVPGASVIDSVRLRATLMRWHSVGVSISMCCRLCYYTGHCIA